MLLIRGLRMVTPSQEVYKLLMREDVAMERRREDREYQKRNAPTLDCAPIRR